MVDVEILQMYYLHKTIEKFNTDKLSVTMPNIIKKCVTHSSKEIIGCCYIVMKFV